MLNNIINTTENNVFEKKQSNYVLFLKSKEWWKGRTDTFTTGSVHFGDFISLFIQLYPPFYCNIFDVFSN